MNKKSNQKKTKFPKKKFSLSLLAILFILQIFLGIFSYPRPAQAQWIVQDIAANIWRVTQNVLKITGDIAFKNMLRSYLNQMAYESAVYVASGGRGQKPLFKTMPVKEVFEYTADAAYGDYLDSLVQNWTGHSLCEPVDITQKLGLILPFWLSVSGSREIGLKVDEPGPPIQLEGKCPVSDIIENVEATSQQKLFEFSKTFNPQANDLGILLAILAQSADWASLAQEKAEFETQLEGLYESVRSKITGEIKTPSPTVEEVIARSWGETFSAYKTYTGSAVADAIGVFTNTLTAKWLEKFFEEGLNPRVDMPGSGFGFWGGGPATGIAAAQVKFASLVKPEFVAGGSIDILNELSSCPSENPGLFNCVIDNNFRIAIEQKMTVKEAIENGFLDGNKPFGFSPAGEELDYQSGYSYRNIIILRKYRIVPVGWELAAEYIKQFGGNYSLKEVMDAYDTCGRCEIEANGEGEISCLTDEDCDGVECDTSGASPFCRLVNPNWVLKAPDTYCKRNGWGEQTAYDEWICENPNDEGVCDTEDHKKTLHIQRQNVCVDEQSCIAENKDGTCRAYGYCVEERPIWRFKGTECPAYYDSCEAYTSREGETEYYLRKTLEFDNCTADNAGCNWYCAEWEYDEEEGGKWACEIDSGTKSYFNKNLQTCEDKYEGCHEYIRTQDSNLICNSSFEYFTPPEAKDELEEVEFNSCTEDWEVGGGIHPYARSQAYFGQTSAALFNDNNNTAGLSDYFNTGYPLANRSFTFSIYAKAENDCQVSGALFIQPKDDDLNRSSLDVTLSNSWQRYEISQTFASNVSEEGVEFFFGTINGCGETYFDGAQLEEEFVATPYQDYGTSKIYQRVDNRYDCLENPDRSECQNYALACKEEDVGCQKYIPVQGGNFVPGIITNPLSEVCSDLTDPGCSQCPAEMVGCQAFRESPLTQNQPDPDHLERMGMYCSGNQTRSCNTDHPCGDGEGECLPSISFLPTTGTSCNAENVGCEEYTNLDEVAKGGEGKEYYSYIRPCIKPDDPLADCQTYYTWEGDDTTGYQLKTFYLRKSDLDNAPCTNLNFEGDPPYVCNDGGMMGRDCQDEFGQEPDCREFYYVPAGGSPQVFYRYLSRTSTCSEDCHPLRSTLDNKIYYARTQESKTCPPSALGCREYKGSAGSNVAIIINEDFEDGDLQSPYLWQGGEISNESIYAGGHSMYVNMDWGPYSYAAITDVSGTVKKDASYLVSFWAKSDGGSDNIKALFSDRSSRLELGSAASSPDEWRSYTFGPVYFDREVSEGEMLVFDNGSHQFWIDNIVLKEVTDSIYLIKGSFELCTGYENCEEYKDQNNSSHYLKSFAKLCEEEKIGCEVLIDTQNSTYPFEEKFFEGTEGEVTVPTDSVVLYVNDPTKYCRPEDKGCSFFGQPIIDRNNQIQGFEDVYIEDNPDDYGTLLCQESELGCEEYAVGDSTTKVYFKNPGEKTCEYRRPVGQTEYKWYKTKTESETEDIECPIQDDPPSPPAPSVPGESWVGLCNSESRGCTEYRDPEDPVGCDATLPDDGDPESGEDCAHYYYLSHLVDATSCNGIVHRDEGCRLFADTSDLKDDGHINLIWEADETKDGNVPTPCASLTCDSNIVLKVDKDRVCDKWLSCTASMQVEDRQGNKENVCYQVGLCNQLGESGGCVNYLDEEEGQEAINMTYDSARYEGDPSFWGNVEDMENISGLVRTGLDWGLNSVGDSQIIEGYYPYQEMPQVGQGGASEKDLVSNGDLEEDETSYEPWEGKDSTLALYERKEDGSEVPVTLPGDYLDENNILKISLDNNHGGAGNEIERGKIISNQEYVASFDLKATSLVQDDTVFTAAFSYGDSIDSGDLQTFGTFRPLQGWREYILGPMIATNSKTNEDTYLIIYQSGGDETVDFFLDNVSLKPVLEVQTLASGDKYIRRICRSYAKEDSIYCRYTDINGIEYKGWYGYCIEPDPKNERYCLQWWPVDVLSGESDIFGGKTAAGYSDRVPLYYCLQAQGNYEKEGGLVGSERYKIITRDGGCSGSSPGQCIAKSNEGIFDRCYWSLTGCTSGSGWESNSGVITRQAFGAEQGLKESDIEKIIIEVEDAGAGEGTDTPGVRTKWILNKDNDNAWQVTWCGHNEDEGSSDCPDSDGIQDLDWDEAKVYYETVNGCNGLGDNDSSNIMSVKAWFDGSGNFENFTAGFCDDSPNEGYIIVSSTFYLREPCRYVAQVVTDTSENKAWTGRVSSNSYEVSNLLYTKGQDYDPFGGIREGEGEPPTWDSKAEEGKQPLYVEAPNNQARAGSPYACEENCSGRMCVGGDDEGESCDSNVDCENGLCIGLGPVNGGGGGEEASNQNLDFAINRLKRLFADAFHAWEWVEVSGYSQDDTGIVGDWRDDYRNMSACKICTEGSDQGVACINDSGCNLERGCSNTGLGRGSYNLNQPEADYCGVYPRVSNIKIKVGGGDWVESGRIEIEKGQAIQVAFNTHVDKEQLPLKNIWINFGPSGGVVYESWNAAPKSDPDNPHIFTYVYEENVEEGEEYRVGIRITDNWQWCNGARNMHGYCDNIWAYYNGTIKIKE